MQAIYETVVYFYRNAKLQAVAVWDVFSPGDAGDGVVFAVGGGKIALICECGKVYPGQAGEVDYTVGFLGGIQENCWAALRFLASSLNSASEPMVGMVTMWKYSLSFFRSVKLGMRGSR